MANAWFRLYADIANNPKIRTMSETFQLRYIWLLCEMCNGRIVSSSNEELAFALRITLEELDETKTVLMKKGLIDENFIPTTWEEKQFISCKSTDRVRRHRERKRLEKIEKDTILEDTLNENLKRFSNVSETPPDTDTDTDIIDDCYKEKIQKSEPEGTQAIYGWIEKKMNLAIPLPLAPLLAWLEWGASFELDIQPVIDRYMVQHPGNPPRSLAWLNDRIATSILQRKQPMPSAKVENAKNTEFKTISIGNQQFGKSYSRTQTGNGSSSGGAVTWTSEGERVAQKYLAQAAASSPSL